MDENNELSVKPAIEAGSVVVNAVERRMGDNTNGFARFSLEEGATAIT